MYTLDNWQLRWLGHDGFQLTDGQTTIVIDPFQISGGQPADYICITHDHYDHFDQQSIAKIRQINTVIIGPKSVTDQFDEMAVPLLPGEVHHLKDLTLQATAAYNSNKQFHPKAAHNIGFILELGERRLYHAGDTDLIPEMEQLGPIDVALLPVSGTYVMTATEAAQAVQIIKPKVAIPMHYSAIIGSGADATTFATAVGDVAKVVILPKEQPVTSN